uniref:Uncharacterized protein n=1 Tax=Eutreptiella gymnastica TaxID=73025 RepID=A0A7S4CXB8_9EUGL
MSRSYKLQQSPVVVAPTQRRISTPLHLDAPPSLLSHETAGPQYCKTVLPYCHPPASRCCTAALQRRCITLPQYNTTAALLPRFHSATVPRYTITLPYYHTSTLLCSHASTAPFYRPIA